MDENQSIHMKSLKTAIIIEPRKHNALEYVLQNFYANLDESWSFIIFHGNKNFEYVQEILEKNREIWNLCRFRMIHLHVDDLKKNTEYSSIFYNKDFYHYIPTEIFLVFQTDSLISCKYKHFINYFLQYDYVGAPWDRKNIGNGGLSLRRKSKMLYLLENYSKYIHPDIEDLFFSGHIIPDKNILYKPSAIQARHFSIENILCSESFGIHRVFLHYPEHILIRLENVCPGLLKLRDLYKS